MFLCRFAKVCAVTRSLPHAMPSLTKIVLALTLSIAAHAKCTDLALDSQNWGMKVWGVTGCGKTNKHQQWNGLYPKGCHVVNETQVGEVKSFTFSSFSPTTVRLYHNTECSGSSYALKQRKNPFATINWNVDDATQKAYKGMKAFKVSL
ncbi:hypothetical protein BV22DRAFT_479813 [Leucogyrophana mollusca]|uniref:Uncharacterized protein n=1 Tax=Leucogyrophana mollusca TaxID=85980 RepID=A0ACB8BHV4_9AGAM|nr:hypothetical protein BV22DRAFT_479813 [Leucogyrophana mollusca]